MTIAVENNLSNTPVDVKLHYNFSVTPLFVFILIC